MLDDRLTNLGLKFPHWSLSIVSLASFPSPFSNSLSQRILRYWENIPASNRPFSYPHPNSPQLTPPSLPQAPQKAAAVHDSATARSQTDQYAPKAHTPSSSPPHQPQKTISDEPSVYASSTPKNHTPLPYPPAAALAICD